jgi:hypothetical protein
VDANIQHAVLAESALRRKLRSAARSRCRGGPISSATPTQNGQDRRVARQSRPHICVAKPIGCSERERIVHQREPDRQHHRQHFIITDAVSVVALEWPEAQRPRIEGRINEHFAGYAASYLRGSILDVIGISPDRTASPAS